MLEVRFFGQLTDRTGCNKLSLEYVADTDTLMQQLHERFPALAGAKYMLAVNNNMIHSNTILSPGGRIDLLPPFSGG